MFHFQVPVPLWPTAAQSLPAGYNLKAIDNVQMLNEAKINNPNIKTILRHWYTAQVPASILESEELPWYFMDAADRVKKERNYLYNPTNHSLESVEYRWLEVPAATVEDNKPIARTFFKTFIDNTFRQYAHNVDYIEEWNEYFGNTQTQQERQRFINWSIAVAQVWQQEYRTQSDLSHIRLILANTAIGNDIPLETAQAAQQYDALLGYHPYWPVRFNQVLPDEWRWYSGRWTEMDKLYKANGVTVEWIFTEAGAVRYWQNGGISLDPYGGWRHPECHDANHNEYLDTIGRWMNLTRTWNEQNSYRARMPVLFNSNNGGGPWDSFNLMQPYLNIIADFVHQWPTQEPPDPPGEPCRGAPRIQYGRVYNVLSTNIGELQAQQIFLESMRNDRQTVGFSFDDAGIGDLDNRLARLHGIPPEMHQTFLNWFAENYPGVTVEFINYD